MTTASCPVVWLTGLSGAGKSTLATALREHFKARNVACVVLDGDVLRAGLCSDLGFSPADRHENIRRVAEVARLFSEAGVVAICALISPLRADRELARLVIGAHRFFEVYVSTPLEECERRDPKGLYRRARANELAEFTGISAPYEAPTEPALRLDTSEVDLAHAVAKIAALLRSPVGAKTA